MLRIDWGGTTLIEHQGPTPRDTRCRHHRKLRREKERPTRNTRWGADCRQEIERSEISTMRKAHQRIHSRPGASSASPLSAEVASTDLGMLGPYGAPQASLSRDCGVTPNAPAHHPAMEGERGPQRPLQIDPNHAHAHTHSAPRNCHNEMHHTDTSNRQS
jgi:hypothetical protein